MLGATRAFVSEVDYCPLLRCNQNDKLNAPCPHYSYRRFCLYLRGYKLVKSIIYVNLFKVSFIWASVIKMLRLSTYQGCLFHLSIILQASAALTFVHAVQYIKEMCIFLSAVYNNTENCNC